MVNVKLCLVLAVCCCGVVSSYNIDVAECQPPDFPKWGGYGPRQDFYAVGDVIHYYCDADTYIGGNFYRYCQDNGEWIGNTPFCDEPTEFLSVNQSSYAEPEEENNAELVTDGLKNTCSSTSNGRENYWMGVLKTPGELFRVMVFMPKVETAYEVVLLKRNGEELSCGSRERRIDRLAWEYHNCPESNDFNVIGVKIKSLSSNPLQICEVRAFVLTTPTCMDPQLRIENGRLQLTRKIASLVCNLGYTRSKDARIECVRTGDWSSKHLYCLVPKCPPPDFPRHGDYGPKQVEYKAGDIIHYFCHATTYIGGNYYRRCEDNGDWTGDTPVCDKPTQFSSVNQTSSAFPVNENQAELVIDGRRSTCSSTEGGNGAYWMGILQTPGELIRVMVFMPNVEAAYEVILLKQNGAELSCGSQRRTIDRLDWTFHNCPGPNNVDAIGIKIKSLSSDPLHICEIRAHVLTTPTCVDPHFHVENGQLQLSRKTASLNCEKGYRRGRNDRIDCIRTGVWQIKRLICTGTMREISDPLSDDEP